MSHLIDIGALQEKMFVLRHLSLASKDYCRQEYLESPESLKYYQNFDFYWSELKGILSNSIIESAVKLRMIQEFCYANGSVEQLKGFESEASESLTLGIIHSGSFKLTLRESANKIIHSTSAKIEFVEENIHGIKNKYWDGRYHLFGTHNKNAWHLELNVNDWANAVSRYINALALGSDSITYLGQDWA